MSDLKFQNNLCGRRVDVLRFHGDGRELDPKPGTICGVHLDANSEMRYTIELDDNGSVREMASSAFRLQPEEA
ncbi:hypothetical protein IIC65_04295 [Candidatus Sumerlaeota bacterium]|nr:hypothetical protein [Candidatus Sumerlaeota bacterium]